MLADAGFVDFDIEPSREYHLDDADLLGAGGIDVDDVAGADGHISSALVRATKPLD